MKKFVADVKSRLTLTKQKGKGTTIGFSIAQRSNVTWRWTVDINGNIV